ncbi:hypothetical protein GCM10025867_10950 [Frondihabitans sucicola]|uniref:Crotonase/enoyl-CoA hydratase family protein n=1 Tax=Frondihabitans sucicola TaxID=1268041 RepID=A0ABM8GKX3_9MICO|nr:enoyl-CoA hydratase-related protein [Frondihabitans sucicola]BDZ48854.1 hypothetical protein GCM10025867_10950 [Frondihabitans sucicola]
MTDLVEDPVPFPLGGEGAVLAEVRGHVLLVTINRPEARNAVDVNVTRGIGEALDRAEQDADVWVVILTGSGDLSFCAGQDLKEAAAGVFFDGPEAGRWGFAGYANHAVSKPTIAAVNGYALGGGTELVLVSDLAVASETATFGLPEVTRGILAGAGGSFRLPRQIPQKIGMEAVLTGRPMTAQRAYELGLVNRVVPPRSSSTRRSVWPTRSWRTRRWPCKCPSESRAASTTGSSPPRARTGGAPTGKLRS